jgi:hypothetical protein
MKFTLTYDGPLPASANKPKAEAKWEIRKHFHPQLEDLFRSHVALQGLAPNDAFPLDGAVPLQGHHLYSAGRQLREPFPIDPLFRPGETRNLNEPIAKHGRLFRPLVRDSYALHCGLKVLFLRKEPPGRVYQGGDIDGRIKTLLDALTMPQHLEEMRLDPGAPDPMYCLMEDDSMVSGLQVESERLLTDQTHSRDYVRLIIEVDVRVRVATVYNQAFLG